MTESKRTRGIPVVARLLLVCATLVAGSSFHLAAPEGTQLSDEEYVESLEAAPGGPVDPHRLAKLLFSVASTLDSGRGNVRLLQQAISVRKPAGESVRSMFGGQYARYEEAVGSFKADVSRLLDAPGSRSRLYRALMNGHRACWRFDGYTRLAETYGASSGDLLSVLSSTEACDLFRRAAFQPRVEALIEEALASAGVDRSEELRELREELAAMEELLEDLRRIDSQE